MNRSHTTNLTPSQPVGASDLEPHPEEFSDARIAYMEMIEGVINRLASTSAVFKGFAITIFAGMFALASAEGPSNVVAVVALFSATAIIAVFDCWYFLMEKRYRKLFNLVRTGEHPIDFDMRNDKDITVGLSEVLKSPAVWAFYLALAAGCAVLLALRCMA